MSGPLTFGDALDRLEALDLHPRLVGDSQVYSCCPCHDDRKPSLSVTDGEILLVHCFTGCRGADVLRALRNGVRGEYQADPERVRRVRSRPKYRFQESAVYQYKATDGTPLVKQRGVLVDPESGEVVGKSFRWNWHTGAAWSPGDGGKKPLLYHSELIEQAVQRGERIVICEGEKDADLLVSKGVLAVSSPHGVSNWRDEWVAQLADVKELLICADDDGPGRKYARTVAARFADKKVAVVLPKTGKDVTDHYAAGFGLDQMVPMDGGAAVLDAVRGFIARFVAFPATAATDATALWAAHTHALDSFDSSPRIAFLSPEPGSGKTRAQEVLELLVPRPMFTLNASAAALFRKVAAEDGRPTVLLDEADTIFGPRAAREHEDLRGFVNGGHRKGAVATRCVVRGKNVVVEDYPSYAAVSLSGLNDLPDTIMSRAVVIRMRKRKPSERVEQFRHRLHRSEGERLRGLLGEWVGCVANELASVYPDLPDGVEDRAADVWEPLIAIADAAGGDWPARARRAAVTFVRAAAEDALESLGVRLLRDLRIVFDTQEQVATDELLRKLHGLPESPWVNLRGLPLDALGLSSRLRRFEVAPRQLRFADDIQRRGYRRVDLADAWSRYLPDDLSPSPREPVAPVTAVAEQAQSPENPGRATGVTGATANRGGGEADVPTHCRTCGAELMLRQPGRDQCERCRLTEQRGTRS